jgi:hypothetical protein
MATSRAWEMRRGDRLGATALAVALRNYFIASGREAGAANESNLQNLHFTDLHDEKATIGKLQRCSSEPIGCEIKPNQGKSNPIKPKTKEVGRNGPYGVRAE